MCFMKILVLTSDIKEKGGVGNYYRCLDLSAKPNIDYFFVNRINTSSIMTPTSKNKLIYIKKLYLLLYLYFKFLILAPKYQLIHINPSLTQNAFYRDMLFILIAKMYRKKVLIFFRGWSETFEQKIIQSKVLSFLFKNTFGKADSIIVLGQVFSEKIKKMGIEPALGIFQETTVADTRFLADFNLKAKLNSYDKQVNFLFISRILKAKGIYIAIDAFNECQQSHSERSMSLYIAGEGEELSSAKAYVKRLQINNVHFLGNIQGEEKKDVLHQCHIMMFPTFHGEGQPNCILEGMLYGMPILSRITAGIPDVVKQGENGFLTESLDSREFVVMCNQLLTNPTLYSRIAQTNHEFAMANFSTECVKQRLLSIYSQLAVRPL